MDLHLSVDVVAMIVFLLTISVICDCIKGTSER